MTNSTAVLREYTIWAVGVLAETGLSDNGWTFAWDTARTRGGICRHGLKKICVSKILTQMNDAEWFRQVLLHEAGHALVGPGKAHGVEWRNTVRRLGGDPARCHTGEVIREEKKIIAICPRCQAACKTARRKKDMSRWGCRKCSTRMQWFLIASGQRIDPNPEITVMPPSAVRAFARLTG
jgi:SprT protein